jgi:hypothetical protein
LVRSVGQSDGENVAVTATKTKPTDTFHEKKKQ